MKKIIHTAILLIGVLVGASTTLATNTTTERCRSVVLADLEKTAKFSASLGAYVGSQDFLTTLRGE